MPEIPPHRRPSPPPTGPTPPPSGKAMTRTQSRLFVVICLVLILGTAVFSVVFLRDMAISNVDRIEADSVRSGSGDAVRGFGVTDG